MDRRFAAIGFAGCALVCGCVRPISPSPPALAFSPSSIDLKDAVPGTIESVVRLSSHGNSELTDIRVGATCGCIDLIDKSFKRIAPGETVNIRFRVSHSTLTDISQEIIVNPGTQGQVVLPVHVTMLKPFIELRPGTPFEVSPSDRQSALAKSRIQIVPITFSPQVTELSVRCATPWLHIDVVPNGLSGHAFRVWTDEGAPDGPFTSECELDVKANRGSFASSILIAGAVRSSFMMDESALFLGVVERNVSVKRTIPFKYSNAAVGPITCKCDSKDVTASVVRGKDAGSGILSVCFVGHHAGEIHDAIRISCGDKDVGGGFLKALVR